MHEAREGENFQMHNQHELAEDGLSLAEDGLSLLERAPLLREDHLLACLLGKQAPSAQTSTSGLPPQPLGRVWVSGVVGGFITGVPLDYFRS